MHGFPSIHGLKSIGYVQLIFSHSYTKPLLSTRPRTRDSSKPTNCAAMTAVAMAVVVLVAAFAIPYHSTSLITLRSSAK